MPHRTISTLTHTHTIHIGIHKRQNLYSSFVVFIDFILFIFRARVLINLNCCEAAESISQWRWWRWWWCITSKLCIIILFDSAVSCVRCLWFFSNEMLKKTKWIMEGAWQIHKTFYFVVFIALFFLCCQFVWQS